MAENLTLIISDKTDYLKGKVTDKGIKSLTVSKEINQGFLDLKLTDVDLKKEISFSLHKEHLKRLNTLLNSQLKDV